jgi:beta-lactamase superfamily II metal-dependent hydrolase
MKLIIGISGWAAQFPSGNFNVTAPSVGACVFYYVVLLLMVTGWIFRSRYKWIVAAALIAIGLTGAFQWVKGWQIARLDIISANGAPVVVASAPGLERTLLVDSGGEDAARELVKPFLCAQGINRLSGLCLAVGRLEYFGGARLILSHFPPVEIATGAPQVRSVAFGGLRAELRKMPAWQSVKDGDSVAGWTVLHPASNDSFTRADDSAVALRREMNGYSVLLLPSLGRDGQDALMRRHPDLRADFVVAGLPSLDEPLCDPLLKQLQPIAIIVADAKFPASHRAPEKLRQRLARFNAKVFFGRDNGAMTLELKQREWSLRTAEGQPAIEASENGGMDNATSQY